MFPAQYIDSANTLRCIGNANPWYSEHPHIPKLLEHPVLIEVGKKYNKSPAQVALAWGVTHGR